MASPSIPSDDAWAGWSDAERRRDLRRNKRVASGLLLGVAAVFLSTLPVREPGFWVLLLRSGAEAALIGGIADWFAVTALFRHPLGLPIPHTAIVVTQKRKLATRLGGFVQRHLLDPESVAARVRDSDPALRAADWLADDARAADVASRLLAAVPELLGFLQDGDAGRGAVRGLIAELQALPIAPLLEKVLRAFVATDDYDDLLVQAIDTLRRAIASFGPRLYGIVERSGGWYMPRTVNIQLTRSILTAADELLADMRRPGSANRAGFERVVAKLIADITGVPACRERVEHAKATFLANADVEGWVAMFWSETGEAVLADAAKPLDTSRAGQMLCAFVGSVARHLASDAALRARVNDALALAVAGTVRTLRERVGHFLADTIYTWDHRTMVDRLELAVGTDLQFVRVNGTVVGGCVGCALHLLLRLAA